MTIPSGSTAVMARRVEPPDSLDDFPTPPWATRALLRYVLPELTASVANDVAWEPAAGRRIMADVLAEAFKFVYASDVFNYDYKVMPGSFVGQGLGVVDDMGADWIISNPPFQLGVEFVERALVDARKGVAMLLRANWIETEKRYRLFQAHPLTIFAPFAGRVPMVKGRWDPEASTATAYAWFVWWKGPPLAALPVVILIPPYARRECARPSDAARFAVRGAA